ncbi:MULTISPECIES: hypothetical protein [unclassified Bradyrhizobium]|uniref:hypothetical protein n=1 Tax=unclassified Bradyrhizobium TaxID=2631580 RepID=UPI00291643F5|nr:MULTISPECIES: hypothetical protein [unclassified Bradyrhizobium]
MAGAGGIKIDIDARQIGAVGDKFARAKARMPAAISHAVSTVGPVAMGAMKRELPAQTGLQRKTIDKALKGAVRGPTYVIKSKGGNIRLKYFRARETAQGVSAAPWNARQVFPETFIMAGWWPNRTKPIARGQVLRRKGKAKYPMEVVKSGLFIAEEMVTGPSAAAFYSTVAVLLPSIIEGVITGAIIGGGADKAAQDAAAADVLKRYSHVSLNDPLPF